MHFWDKPCEKILEISIVNAQLDEYYGRSGLYLSESDFGRYGADHHVSRKMFRTRKKKLIITKLLFEIKYGPVSRRYISISPLGITTFYNSTLTLPTEFGKIFAVLNYFNKYDAVINPVHLNEFAKKSFVGHNSFRSAFMVACNTVRIRENKDQTYQLNIVYDIPNNVSCNLGSFHIDPFSFPMGVITQVKTYLSDSKKEMKVFVDDDFHKFLSQHITRLFCYNLVYGQFGEEKFRSLSRNSNPLYENIKLEGDRFKRLISRILLNSRKSFLTEGSNMSRK